MHRTSRFWLVYSALWLPYAVSYAAVFVAQGGSSMVAAMRDTVINIVPAALLGLSVLWLCRRLPWPLHRRWWFSAAHLVLALFYAVLWGGAVLLVFTISATFATGRWTPIFWGGYALQWQILAGLMIYGTIASVAYVLQVVALLQAEEQRAAQAEIRAARAEALRTQAELEALRAQLNPHFLFNTLHTLMALVRYDQQTAEDALERFGGMLRYVMKIKREPLDGSEDVPFGDEWDFVQNYLALEKLRLGDRLQVEAVIDSEVLDCPVLAFTIQPLVENAIKHGIAPRARPATLHLSARVKDKMVHLEVRDDGLGAPGAKLDQSQGLGLRVVRQRLEMRYRGAATLEIETAPGAGFAVRITLPLSRQTSGEAERELVKEESWALARS